MRVLPWFPCLRFCLFEESAMCTISGVYSHIRDNASLQSKSKRGGSPDVYMSLMGTTAPVGGFYEGGGQ